MKREVSGRRAPAAKEEKTSSANHGHETFLERFSGFSMRWAGSSWAFGVAVAIIVVWGVTGPLFHYSDSWQLVINTGTTIVTFLMVFLIQRAQNKESKAIQLKLNEIVAAMEGASNQLIDVEDLSEAEIDELHRHYAELVKLVAKRRTGREAPDAAADGGADEAAAPDSPAAGRPGPRVRVRRRRDGKRVAS